MNARSTIWVVLVSAGLFALSSGCRSYADPAPSRDGRAAAAKARWPNPFDEIRHYMDLIGEKDRRILDDAFPNAQNSPIPRKRLAGAIARNQRSVRGIATVARSGGIEEYVSRKKDSYGGLEGRDSTSTMRWAVRFLCNASLAAYDAGDAHEAISRLVAAMSLADSVGMSNEQIWHLTRYGCLTTPYHTARTILGEQGIDRADAFSLRCAFGDAADVSRCMAALRAIWTDADEYRDLNTYVAIYRSGVARVGPADANAGEASENADTEFERGAMNLGARELADTFRRDVQANQSLRQSVLATVSWPFYTLPSDDFWTMLLRGRPRAPQLVMTVQSEYTVAFIIEWSNNQMARSALLDLVLSIRDFEAATGALPATLEELSSFIRESMAAGDVCFPLLGFVDVYSGRAFKYSVMNDAAGRAVSFKLYSVGIDLNDDGGIERPGIEGKRLGTDIVFEGKAAAATR